MTALVAVGAEDLAELLTRYRYRGPNEAAVQVAISEVLTAAGVEHQREVRLTPAERIDFMVGTIGIEVKLGGSSVNLLRQVGRYLALDSVTEILVASTRISLAAAMPDSLHGKRIRTVVLAGGAG